MLSQNVPFELFTVYEEAPIRSLQVLIVNGIMTRKKGRAGRHMASHRHCLLFGSNLYYSTVQLKYLWCFDPCTKDLKGAIHLLKQHIAGAHDAT